MRKEICKHCHKRIDPKPITLKEIWGYVTELNCPLCGSTIEFYDYDYQGNKLLVEVR